MTQPDRAPKPPHDEQSERKQQNESLSDVLERQLGMLSRRQALEHGLTDKDIARAIAQKRWRRVFEGVYATFTGPLPFQRRVWAALLYAGAGAVASHHTAARLWKIGADPNEREADEDLVIHVRVPADRHVARQKGLRIHRSRQPFRGVHPTALPPRTRVEETVADLIDEAHTFEQALTVIMRAVQRGRTTIARIRVAIAERKKLRWRKDLTAPLDDVADGAQTMLEYLYYRDVERAHGLPRGERQHRWDQGGTRRYSDVRYGKYRARSELDGRIGHVEEGAFRDMQRDNAALLSGDATLRSGWLDVTSRSCEAAGHVGAVLQRNGWTGTLRRCGSHCRLPLP